MTSLPEAAVTGCRPADVTSDVVADLALSPDEPLAVEFANTLYAERGRLREGLESPDRLTAWLEAHAAALGAPVRDRGGEAEAATGVVTSADMATFMALRDAIRALIRAEIDAVPPDADALALLNRAAAAVPSWPVLLRQGDRYEVVVRSGGPALATALGALASDAMELLGGDSARALRACQGPGCIQFFVKDHPRRKWCSLSCGNRARVARHYSRHRGDGAER